MTIEYLPVGIACNLKCTYCYQDPMRDAGNINVPRNWTKVKEVLTKLNSDFTVFGGEPLLAPIEHLEEVWKFGFEKFGRNGIQTNGLLIESAHVDLFKRYRVQVGICIDGPDELNNSRCSIDDTHIIDGNIRKLVALGLNPSLIVTVHQVNSCKLLRLTDWVDSLGISYVNFHMLEVERGRTGLSDEENTRIFLELYEWSRTTKVTVEPFGDIRRLLTERKPRVNCTWNHCDPSTTDAVQGITPDGIMSNCGRTNKDGVNWVKADRPGFERYLLLHKTGQEYGGCKDCKFFIFCKGQCPGTAIDGDWRNRTIHCRTWYSLFERIEMDVFRSGVVPISMDCGTKEQIEKEYLNVWTGHGDAPHGDTPHGDSHGDHTDRGIQATILKEPPKWTD